MQSTQDAKRRKKEKDKNDRPEAIGETCCRIEKTRKRKRGRGEDPKGSSPIQTGQEEESLERVWVNSTSSSRGSDADQEGSEADSDLSSEAPRGSEPQRSRAVCSACWYDISGSDQAEHDQRHQDLNVLCLADQAVLWRRDRRCSASSTLWGKQSACLRKASRNWRRPGVKIHRRPCGAVRRPWEHSLPLVSLGASSKRHHHQNARGPQAQEDRPQKPGIQYWRAAVALSRTRERRSPVREGEEGNGKGRGKGKAKVAAGKPREMPAVGERTRLIAGLACAVAIGIGGWSPCFS